VHGQGVVFASEVGALLQDPAVGREWCPTAIDAYLTLGYVPAPSTAFRRISKLEPAHTLTVEGRRLQVRRYWDLPAAGAPRDAVAALDESLRAAMTANVAGAGILYSGGPASTALLAVTPRNEGTPVTVGLDEDSSELTRSDRAALHMHRTRELEFASSPVEILVRALAAQCGEPLADPAALTHLMVFNAARRHGGVLVAGDGAALLWGGRSRDGRHRAEHDLWCGPRRRGIYTRGFAWEVRSANPYQRHVELSVAARNDGAVDRALYVDARTHLSDNEVATAERAAQTAGVTLRCPFLAVPLVELAVTLPPSIKAHGHIGMQPLRTLLSQSLPAALLPSGRPAARHAWLEGALGALVPALLLGPRFDGRGVVSRLALSHLWDEYRAGIGDHSYRLWSLVMLELWFRQFVDGDAALEEPYEYAVVKAA
jgi:asparagine synthase (glutamine-hydrolysing)